MRSELIACDRCGQTADPGAILPGGVLYCLPCAEGDREPQGETVRLFEPAPAQMPGQTMLRAPRADDDKTHDLAADTEYEGNYI